MKRFRGKTVRILALALAAVLLVCAQSAVFASAEESYIEIVPPKYDAVGNFSEGMAAVMLDGKWGFIDKTGKEVIPPIYSDVKDFSDGLAPVRGGQVETFTIGFIDKTGKTIIPQTQWIAGFSEGLALIRRDGKYCFIDTSGDVAITLTYDNARSFSEGMAAVRIGDSETGKWGFIDKTGAEVVPLIYNYVQDFSDGMAAVLTGDWKWGFIDKTGAEVISPIYPDVDSFSEDLAAVLVGEWETGSVWYIDKTGNEVIQAYAGGDSFSGGIAPACPGWTTEWGYIDKSGAYVIPAIYLSANPFSEDLAAVEVSFWEGYWEADIMWEPHKWGFIDSTNEMIIPAIYDGARSFSEGMAAVRIGDGETGKWGFVALPDEATQPVTPPAATQTVYPTPSTVYVNGEATAFEAYIIDGANYFKLRDLATALSGTEKQFEVGYDEVTRAITLTSGKPYTAVGGEMALGDGNTKTANPTASHIYLDGVELNLTVYIIEGSNYFKLRDLMQAIDVYVGYNEETRAITLDTGYGYDTERP